MTGSRGEVRGRRCWGYGKLWVGMRQKRDGRVRGCEGRGLGDIASYE